MKMEDVIKRTAMQRRQLEVTGLDSEVARMRKSMGEHPMQDHLLLQEKFKLALGIDLDRLIRPSAVEQTMREAMEERRRSEELLAGPARQLQKQLKEIAPVIGASSAWTRAMEENARAFEQARDRMMGLGATVRIPDLLAERLKFGIEEMSAVIRQNQFNIARQMEALGATSADSFRKLQESIAAVVPRGILQVLEEHRAEFARIAASQVTEEVALALKNRRWTGVEHYLSRSDLRLLARTRQRKGLKAIDEIICRKFRRKRHALLNQIVRHWWKVAYLKKHKSDVLDALRAHKNGEYRRCIVGLLPKLDGLICATVSEFRGGEQSRFHTPHSELAQIAPQLDENIWVEALKFVLEEVVYASFDGRQKKLRWKLNRNAILHGKVTRYWSEANSLRIILLVDILSRLAARVNAMAANG